MYKFPHLSPFTPIIPQNHFFVRLFFTFLQNFSLLENSLHRRDTKPIPKLPNNLFFEAYAFGGSQAACEAMAKRI